MLYRRFFIVTLFMALLGLWASSILNAAVERDHAQQGGVSLSAQSLGSAHRL